LVAGGLRDKAPDHEHTAEEATTQRIQSHLEQFVADLLGETPAITHRWAGLFGNTSDRLPLVGPVPGNDGVWVVAAGYAGHGNGIACGEMLGRAILGEAAPELDLLDPARLVDP
jgi:glycine/D-amino acid oxidase-like deaminating enzyme